jgi:hypothetical protein
MEFHLNHNTSQHGVPSQPLYQAEAVMDDNTRSYVYSYVLQMIGGGTA